jgi:hypothetical protein
VIVGLAGLALALLAAPAVAKVDLPSLAQVSPRGRAPAFREFRPRPVPQARISPVRVKPFIPSLPGGVERRVTVTPGGVTAPSPPSRKPIKVGFRGERLKVI